jgi:hypothetical protein
VSHIQTNRQVHAHYSVSTRVGPVIGFGAVYSTHAPDGPVIIFGHQAATKVFSTGTFNIQ